MTSKAKTPSAKSVVAKLRDLGKKSVRDGYSRYGIVAPKSFGIEMHRIHRLAREIGRDHDLAEKLWTTGWYEARLLVAFVGEPERLTPAQMERWTGDFDNWAVCDTLCFHLFDRSRHAFPSIRKWARRREEFMRRAGSPCSHASRCTTASAATTTSPPAFRWSKRPRPTSGTS